MAAVTPVTDIIATPSVPRVPPAHPGRLVALDHLRGFIVALVVLHHSVLAYCRFGHVDAHHYLWSSAPIVDPERWVGFDLLVRFNDSFFMPLMFLLSGLFVWASVARKGAAGYVSGRLLRLRLPFAVAATTLIPLAYYPSFRMTGADAGFWRFWSDMVFSGPWPSGPLWFIAMLLGFDAVVALLFSLGLYPRLSPTRLSPLAFAGLLMTMSAIAYLPLLAEFGARRWLTFGPLAVQASRIGLYALYFLAGVWLGRSGADRGLIAPTGALSRHWAAWTASLVAVTLATTQAVKLRSDNLPPEIAWLNPRGLALVIFCTTACLALLAMFLRFGTLPRPTRNSLAANAYGIFILHYPLVTWTQYALLGTRTGAVVKAGLAFGVALALSWLAAALLRRVPGVRAIV